MGRGGGSGSSSQESSPSSSCIRSLMSSSLPTICTPEARATRSMWAFSAFIMYVAGAHPSFPFCLQKCYILNVLSGFLKKLFFPNRKFTFYYNYSMFICPITVGQNFYGLNCLYIRLICLQIWAKAFEICLY